MKATFIAVTLALAACGDSYNREFGGCYDVAFTATDGGVTKGSVCIGRVGSDSWAGEQFQPDAGEIALVEMSGLVRRHEDHPHH